MSTRKFTKRKTAAKNLDPATLAKQKHDAHLRELAARTLRKRRQRKSGQ